MKMKYHPLTWASAACCCFGMALPAAAEIEAAANDALKAMSEKVGKQETFRFTAKRTLSEDLAAATGGGNGKSDLVVSVKRPSHVHVAASGDSTTRDFYFNGKQVTLADSTANVYAARDFSGTIDDMLDKLEEALGFSPPVGDLIASNLHESLLGGEQDGKVAGKEKVGGAECQHLTFSHPNVDWEIWIDSDHLPRKFRVTYKAEETEGDLALVIDEISWALDAKVSAETFAFTAPDGAEKIEMLSPQEASDRAEKAQ